MNYISRFEYSIYNIYILSHILLNKGQIVLPRNVIYTILLFGLRIMQPIFLFLGSTICPLFSLFLCVEHFLNYI